MTFVFTQQSKDRLDLGLRSQRDLLTEVEYNIHKYVFY